MSRIGHALALIGLAALFAWFWNLQGQPWPTINSASRARWISGIAVAAFGALCAGLAWQAHRAKSGLKNFSSPVVTDEIWHVFHASQTGFAQELAERAVEMIHGGKAQAMLHALQDFDAERFANARCIFIASTTGEGDPPDRVVAFARGMASPADFSNMRYALLALGDKTYAHYCAFGRALDDWLLASGATPLQPRIDVDNANSEALRAWTTGIAELTGGRAHAEIEARPWASGTLESRRLLNPGSAGGPMYLVRIAVPEATSHDDDARNRHWQAGDILEVLPSVADATTAVPAQVHREYSIANIRQDGALELVVRLVHTPDGRAGVGSGWLCDQATPGSRIALRIRSNPNFHTPDGSSPLILIGNGTGIAGLRAHTQTRLARHYTRNWLIFGERNTAHDTLLPEEFDAWEDSGMLIDRVWSRDGDETRYVQHRLAKHATRLRAWIADGASLMVCGSIDGMAPGVDAVLRAILGDGEVDRLLADGRYRRDVY